jgi:uncharacterized protein YjbI with pentapeptide repeats
MAFRVTLRNPRTDNTMFPYAVCQGIVMVLSRCRAVVTCVFVLMLGLISMVVVPNQAMAQENTVDYTLTDLSFRDFAGQNLSGTSFAAAEARDADFHDSDLSRTILTKASFLRANLAGLIYQKPLPIEWCLTRPTFPIPASWMPF